MNREAEESTVLEAVISKRLVKTQQTEKILRAVVKYCMSELAIAL
jgi:hypothetical protein